MGKVEAPNPGMVEAKRKAKWPARGQATERECRPGQSPQEGPYGRNQKVLRTAGACKPEDERRELATLKCAAPGHLEEGSWHKEMGLAWEDLEESHGPHFESIELWEQAPSTAEEEDTLQTQNQVSLAGIDYADVHAPLFPFSIDLGHSCSAYPHSF